MPCSSRQGADQKLNKSTHHINISTVLLSCWPALPFSHPLIQPPSQPALSTTQPTKQLPLQLDEYNSTMSSPKDYICVICSEPVEKSHRQTHLDTHKHHAQVKLFLEAHKDGKKLLAAKMSVQNNNGRCEVCPKSLGKRAKKADIDTHLKEGGHVNAVKSKWSTFQDATRNHIGLAADRFPDGTLEQNFTTRITRRCQRMEDLARGSRTGTGTADTGNLRPRR